MGTTVVETAQVVLETIDQGATAGVRKLEGPLAQLDMAAQAASRSMAQLRENYQRAATATGPVAGAVVGGVGGGAAVNARFADFRETEKDLQRVLALMDTIPQKLLSVKEKGGLRQVLLGAKDPATEIDAVNQRLDFLRTKMVMLQQASGGGWQAFRAQINAATTGEQLVTIQTQMDQIGVKAGIAAPRVQSLRATMRSWVTDLVAAHPVLTGFAAAMAGMFVMTGIMTATSKLREFIVGIRDLAFAQRQLHIEAMETGLQVGTLEAYRVAAAETGVELGQLRMGMRQLSVNMEKHPEAFRALGIEVKNVYGEMRSLDEIMPELATVFSGMTNQTEKLELASALLGGRMGARLLPMLTLGREEMQAFREEGMRLGVIMSDTADRDLTRLARTLAVNQLAWEGLKKQMQLELLPTIELLAGAFIRLAAITMQWKNVLEWLLDPLGKFVEVVGPLVTRPMPETPKWMSMHAPVAGPETTEAAERARKAIQLLLDAANTSKIDELMEKLKRLGQTSADINALAAAFDGSRAQMEKWAKTYGEDTALKAAATALVMRQLRQEYGDMAAVVRVASGVTVSANESTEESVGRVRDAWNGLLRVTLMGAAPVQAVQDRIRSLNDEFESGRRTLSEYTREMAKLNEELVRASGVRGYSGLTKEERDRSAKALNNLFLKPVPNIEPRALPEDEARWEGGWLKLSRDIEDAEKKVNHLRDFTVNVVQGMVDALYQPFNDFLNRVFASKSAWAAFWHILSDMAIRELLRIAETKLLLFLANLFTHGVAAPITTAVDTATRGVGLVPMRSLAPLLPGVEAAMATAPTEVNYNYTIQTFSPRDTLMQLLSPEGVLRRAYGDLALTEEY